MDYNNAERWEHLGKRIGTFANIGYMCIIFGTPLAFYKSVNDIVAQRQMKTKNALEKKAGSMKLQPDKSNEFSVISPNR